MQIPLCGTQENITKDKDIVFKMGKNVHFKDNLDFGEVVVLSLTKAMKYNINGQDLH